MPLIPSIEAGDWIGVNQNFQKINARLDETSSPTFSDVTLNGLTANRIISVDSDKKTASVTDLTAWIAGTTNQITVTDDTDGTVTLSLPQDIHTAATPTFGSVKYSDDDASHTLNLLWNEAETSADRTLNITGLAESGDRTLDLQGNLTVESASTLNQDLTTDADVTFNECTLTTLPFLANRLLMGSGNGMPGTGGTITETDLSDFVSAGESIVVLDGDGGVSISAVQALDTDDSPTFADLTLSSPSNIYALEHDSFANPIHDGHTLQLDGINSDGGAFSFTTTGKVTFNQTIGAATGSTIGNLTLANGSITDSSGAISFDNENLTTTGTLNGMVYRIQATRSMRAGEEAGTNATGADSVYLGYRAGYGATGGSDNTGTYNIGIGPYVLYDNTTGQRNTALGYNTLANNTIGQNNWAAGYNALLANTQGNSNFAAGSNTLMSNVTGANNVAISENALQFSTGSNNVSIGADSLRLVTSGNNTTAIGYIAGRYISSGAALTTSNNSTFIGYDARPNADSCSNETVIGYGARGQGNNTVSIGNTSVTDNYFSGNLHIGTDKKLWAGQDSYVGYDGTNLVLSPREAGTGGVAIGVGAGGVDYKLIFDGETYDGTFIYYEDEDVLNWDGGVSHVPDEITATDAGVAASLLTVCTEVTTNGDSDTDNVTLANGMSGQLKYIYCVATGHPGDSWKITPANMVGGTQISFTGAGEGCILRYADNEGWCVVANNGGTIA